jgi:hypothetical protein
MEHIKFLFPLGTLALVFSLAGIAAGCGGAAAATNDDALYELAGSWYDSRYNFAFKITAAGEGYIARNKTQCAVSASGRFVYFRDSHGNSLGSFCYFIKNGALDMTFGIGDFRDIQATAPFIKSGTIPSGGSVPVELIGAWYTTDNPPPAPNFEIAKQGTMAISGSTTPHYTVKVQGNKIAVLDGSMLKGEFQYSFMDGVMIITNGTADCEGLAILSPFVKKSD